MKMLKVVENSYTLSTTTKSSEMEYNSEVQVVSAPPMQIQYNSPSLSKKPLLPSNNNAITVIRTNLFTPLGSPIRRAIQLTKLDPQDAWLPITESRNGNSYYAAFHTLSSGIGIQALIVPVAFTILGWYIILVLLCYIFMICFFFLFAISLLFLCILGRAWGVICLMVAFVWQLYTLWLLVNLHESTETGMRFSRYLQLFSATFG